MLRNFLRNWLLGSPQGGRKAAYAEVTSDYGYANSPRSGQTPRQQALHLAMNRGYEQNGEPRPMVAILTEADAIADFLTRDLVNA